MLTEDRIYLFRQAVKQWGNVLQWLQAVEEMGELTSEVCHLIRGRINTKDEHLAEEIADVELCLEQLVDICQNWCEVEDWKNKKMQRLEERLKEAKNG